MLAVGSVVAQENRTPRSRASMMAKAGFNLSYGKDQIVERVIDQRIIDRLGLFDRSEGHSGRYNLSLDLENEDSDWSFEVTVTIEF
jgi:hypothetical protein